MTEKQYYENEKVERESIEVRITQKYEQKEETLAEKMTNLRMKGTNKHTES